jgi:predicted MFS family arabinose efflux permease
MLWGVAFGGIPLCCSVWMQRTTPDNAEAGSALFVCIVQVAIAVGSSVGGLVVDHVGSPDVFRLGAVVALLGLITLARTRARTPAATAAMKLRGNRGTSAEAL